MENDSPITVKLNDDNSLAGFQCNSCGKTMRVYGTMWNHMRGHGITVTTASVSAQRTALVNEQTVIKAQP